MAESGRSASKGRCGKADVQPAWRVVAKPTHVSLDLRRTGEVMAIRQPIRQLRLPYTSEAFPAGSIANGNADLSVSWPEILWAALTIGRPSVHHVFRHGSASLHEAIFRLSLVRMALEQYGPSATRLRRTAALKNLDPTEKGAISYFLGMTFCKVFASRLLSTPWLLHLDVFKGTISTSSLGRSRPDLFGQQTGTGAWLAFETKGRASKPSSADRAKAKDQAVRLVAVNGSPCTLHVGAFTFFAKDALNFYWIDPPPNRKKPIEIPEVDGAWRYYYEPARALWRTRAHDKDDGELILPLPELDLTLHVHPLLAPLFMLRTWEVAQRRMFAAAEQLKADGYQPDGLKVECGPSWRERLGSSRDGPEPDPSGSVV